MTASEFVSRLEHVNKSPGGWTARCPAHADHKNSLSVGEGQDDRVLIRCFAQCTPEAIVKAMGLEMSDLFVDSAMRGNGTRKSMGKIEAAYDFVDESGKLLYQEVRFEPKDFRLRRPDGKGGWVWHLECDANCKCTAKLRPVRRVLYNLPAVLKAPLVLVVEGPKDCETAKNFGLVATTNSSGAHAPWLPEYSKSLRDKPVCLIADADAPGAAHTKDAARSLVGVAQSVKLIEALPGVPFKGDLTDYFERGGTRETLLTLIREVPELTPSDVVKLEPSKPATGFTLTPLGDLLSKPDTPVDYLLDGRLVLGTVSALVGKPKVGKGTLARNLCLAVGRGEEFLGFGTKQGECIYLALEEREEDVRNDFRAMGADGTEPIFIHAAAAPAEGMKVLCALVRERKPRLVVIDPIFRLARVKDEKAYAETYAALGPLIDAARESGSHVMILHHSGKSLKADAIDSPLGSTAIGGAVATLIVIRRTEAYRIMQTVQRIGQDMPETVLQFDPHTKRLSMGGTRDEAEIQNVSGEIAEFLKAAGELKTEPEITGAVEGKTKIVRQALRLLVDEGKVSREGAGRRGDPYRYGFSFSCSKHIAGTREQETQEPGETRENISENLVPTSDQKPFLVPSCSEGQKSRPLTPETGLDEAVEPPDESDSLEL